MSFSPPSLIALGLLAGAGWLLARRPATTGGGADSRAPLPVWGDIDTGLNFDAWGDGWDWAFDGSDGTADTPTYTGGDMSQPRGIRNHNPGNIEYTGTQWQGLADPPSDGRFMRFVSPEYGIRAMARVLTNYERLHGLDYIGGIIQRWAPAHENNVAVYAGFVADRLGVRATDPIDVEARLPELIAAMIEMENGQQPYAQSTINKGVALA